MKSKGDCVIGLKNIRKKRNLNQQKVAMDLNISREALSHYENGKREPSLDMLNKLSDYFNVSIDFLINGEDFDKNKDSIFDLKDKKSVYFKIDGKGYSIPSVDCVFLPLPYTSAEELSKFFAETLAKKLSETYDNLQSVSVCVNEGIGQGAAYRKDL